MRNLPIKRSTPMRTMINVDKYSPNIWENLKILHPQLPAFHSTVRNLEFQIKKKWYEISIQINTSNAFICIYCYRLHYPSKKSLMRPINIRKYLLYNLMIFQKKSVRGRDLNLKIRHIYYTVWNFRFPLIFPEGGLFYICLLCNRQLKINERKVATWLLLLSFRYGYSHS